MGKEIKDLARQNKNADPKGADQLKQAADKVNDANKKQDGAKSDLNMNMPKAGGEKANDAAQKLDYAAKDVQAQLDQKKGQEANDQAALQPNSLDPNNAAQQLQKAIDQANKAAEKANEAAMNQPMQKGQPNIAELRRRSPSRPPTRNSPTPPSPPMTPPRRSRRGTFPTPWRASRRPSTGSSRPAKREWE